MVQRLSSVVRRLSSGVRRQLFPKNHFFSETTGPTALKLARNDPDMVPTKCCYFSGRSEIQYGRQAAILKNLFRTSSQVLQVGLSWNLLGMILTWSRQSVVIFRVDQKFNMAARQPSWKTYFKLLQVGLTSISDLDFRSQHSIWRCASILTKTTKFDLTSILTLTSVVTLTSISDLDLRSQHLIWRCASILTKTTKFDLDLNFDLDLPQWWPWPSISTWTSMSDLDLVWNSILT